MMDITYHYPPDLTQLLIQTSPRLCPRKKYVVLFFRGAGVAGAELNPLGARSRDRQELRKQVGNGPRSHSRNERNAAKRAFG